MKKPIVAVSLRQGSQRRTPKEQNYLNWVIREGGIPRVIKPDDRYPLNGVSGLLLTGGEDVAPWRYGQKDRYCEDMNPDRDRFEFQVLKEALRKNLPVLAICRGIQILGIAEGGALYQDLPKALGGHRDGNRVAHRGKKRNDSRHHVEVFRNTDLKKCLGRKKLWVNSNHHQAISRVPKSVRVAARSSDGIIEAIEVPGKSFVLGIQWHPERWKSNASRSIMKKFLSACKKWIKQK